MRSSLPRLAGFVLDAFAHDTVPASLAGGIDPELEQLSPREREVLRLIARGYTYKEVARELTISAAHRRVPRLLGVAEAPALDSPRAHPVGHRAADRLRVRLR